MGVTKTKTLIEAGYQAALDGKPCAYPGTSELARGAWEQGWRAGWKEILQALASSSAEEDDAFEGDHLP